MQVTHTINVWDYGREIGNLKKLIQDCRCQVIYMINSLGQEETDIEYINAKDFLQVSPNVCQEEHSFAVFLILCCFLLAVFLIYC